MLVLSLLFAMLPTSVMADQSAQLLSSETSQTAQVDEVIVENTLLQEDSLQSESDTGNQAEASKEATITQTFRGPISLMVNVGDVFEVAPYKYKVLSENTVALGDGNGSAFVGGANFPTGTVTLPTSVEYNGVTYKVTEISDSAFRTLETNVTTLKIPGTITKIGFGSFRETKGIKNFVLEHGVTYLDQAAFREADAKSITVPVTVNYYGNRALDAPVNNAGDEIAIFEGGLPASTEIYARRAPFFSVRFLNESGSVVESHNIAPGGAVPDPYPAVPPKSGYTAVWSPQDGFDLSEAVNHGFTISPVYTEMDSMTVFDDGVLRYTIDSDTTVMLGDGSNLGALVVTDGSVKYGTLRIPETVTYEDKTYTVTSVADNAFRGFPQDLASGAKFVVRFNWARNIVAVGDSAFRDMYNFEMYNVLSEVKSIGDSAFRDTPFAAALSIGINMPANGHGANAYDYDLGDGNGGRINFAGKAPTNTDLEYLSSVRDIRFTVRFFGETGSQVAADTQVYGSMPNSNRLACACSPNQ